RLDLGTNISLARSITDRARSDNNIYSPWANAIANAPIFPVFNEDGSYFTETTYLNPVGMAREAEAEERGTRIIGNAFAQYQLTEDRKSTRLNSSHVKNSYAVFCLKNNNIAPITDITR